MDLQEGNEEKFEKRIKIMDSYKVIYFKGNERWKEMEKSEKTMNFKSVQKN